MRRRTVLISPLEIDDEIDFEIVGARKRDHKKVWLDAPDFGAWLRGERESLNLSLRKAGERIGVSHTYLALIEQGGGQRPLGMDVYRRMAETYELDEREVLDRAGFRWVVKERVAAARRDLEADRFKALMLYPDFRPADFADNDIDLFPPVVRKYILDLVRRVDENARRRGGRVMNIVDEEVDLL